MEIARKHGIKTTTLRVKFSVQFDQGELDEANSGAMMFVL